MLELEFLQVHPLQLLLCEGMSRHLMHHGVLQHDDDILFYIFYYYTAKVFILCDDKF